MPKGKFLSSEQKQQLVELYSKGLPCKEVADKFNITRAGLFKIVAKTGAVRPIPKTTPVLLSSEQKQLVIETYVSGLSSTEVAQKFGISESTVRKLARNSGAIRPLKVTTDEKREKILDMYRQGVKLAQIIQTLDVCISTVKETIKRSGEKLRAERLSKLQKEKIVELYEVGNSVQNIAETMDCSLGTVHQLLKKLNVELRPIIPHSTRESVVSEYKNGVMVKTIVKTYEVSQKVILTSIRLAGVESRLQKLRAIEHKEQILASYRSGIAMHEMASALGYSIGNIRNLLTRYGLTIKGTGVYSASNWKKDEYRRKIIAIRRKTSLRGECHPNWQGGRTTLQASIRASGLYREWRHLILKRDKYICQNCGKFGGTLDVDHKYPFYRLLTDHKIKSTRDAVNCNALWDTDNGRTLCRDCHKQTPTYGNPTRKDQRMTI